MVDERRLQRMQRAVRASPSIVVTDRPSYCTANAKQDRMRSPSTSTVHAPQAPWSQPFLVPGR